MGLLQALADDDFQRSTVRGLADVGNRGVFAGLLGAPVDASAGVVNAGIMTGGLLGERLGLWPASELPTPIERPVGGSEWIGQKLQDGGWVTPNRNHLAEGLATFTAPFAGNRLAQALPILEAEPFLRLLNPGAVGSPKMVRGGPMKPEGKARLQADLEAEQGSGRYPLGDVTEGQGKGLDRLFGSEAASRDVFMTDEALRHLIERRLAGQGFTPAEVAKYAEQAMASRARPDLNVSKGAQNPSLLNSGMRDPVTGRPYDARVPLKQVDDGYELRSVIPEGIRGRNNKAPER
ncbi:hypothetical protein DBV14_09440 [Variovorax sp. KBW07]|uniref:hypothetical protein n=1 Tax=Variovorax sp. KBW07 TaxID=2153358 RepID=UPI000F57C10E|nr:hypothetical protein [Variovorax sp. KBW07]RQO57022.1 hypothetical protein DBV14_09440 [Variovorax sp. KBW07]